MALAAKKRAGINVNLMNVSDLMFIDHLITADGNIGPNTTPTTAPFYQLLGADGWPDDAEFASVGFKLGDVRAPASSDFAGPYVITWDGVGAVQIVFGGVTWSMDPASQNVVQSPNNRFTNTSGVARAIVSHSGYLANLPLTFNVSTTGTGANRVRNVKFYRLEDEADLLAGKVFRAKVKQQYIDYNAGCIRFMNWNGVNGGSNLVRWRDRNPPGYAGKTSNWHAGLAYGETSGLNQMTLDAVASTPASMQHGEVVTCRIGAGSGIARCGNIIQITGIAKDGTNRVTTGTAHGFQVGDKVQPYMVNSVIPSGGPAVGMTQLHMKVCEVTNVTDATHFDIDIDVTGFSNFTFGYVYGYVSLRVGSGNDRIAYPVMTSFGIWPFGRYGNNIGAGTYRAFTFNKKITINPDIGPGCWVTAQFSGSQVLFTGLPVEFCAIFMNELDAMRPPGEAAPAAWLCIPDQGMMSDDPDYDPLDNFPVNMLTAFRNALDHDCEVQCEHSNETWNLQFTSAVMMRYQGYLAYPSGGSGDPASFSSFRAVKMVSELKAAFPRLTNPSIRYVMGLHDVVGTIHINNNARLNGGAAYTAISGSATVPMDSFDGAAVAPYFNNDETNSNSLTNCVADWVSAGRPTTGATLDAIIDRYQDGMQTSAIGGSRTIDYQMNTLVPAYVTKMKTYTPHKEFFLYECAFEYVGSGTDNLAFIALARASRRYAIQIRAWYNNFNDYDPLCGYGIEFVFTNRTYGHAYPDTYLNGIEGGRLDQAWHALRLRNNSKRRLWVKT
ncbi:MAG: hypothetical protein WC670_18905 [Pseudolabrys sp.]|jgi:hypothetical protein